MRIELLDSAEKDLLDGFKFYEYQAKGLGDYFLDSLFSDIESLIIYAVFTHSILDITACYSKRFPFAIYYRVLKDIIRVYAILDCRRNPAWIRNRLS